MRAVSNTSPLRYLVVTELISLLPRLFEQVAIPTEVQAELQHASAPAVVREWAFEPPQWLHVAKVAEQAGALPTSSFSVSTPESVQPYC